MSVTDLVKDSCNYFVHVSGFFQVRFKQGINALSLNSCEAVKDWNSAGLCVVIAATMYLFQVSHLHFQSTLVPQSE